MLIMFFSLTHKVTVWGDLARTVSNDYNRQLQKSVIGVMWGSKVTLFNSKFIKSNHFVCPCLLNMCG